jgi:hypothetical protein
MTNAPTLTFAQLLGRAPKPAQATPKATPAKATLARPDGKLPPLAGPFAKNVASAARPLRKAASAKPALSAKSKAKATDQLFAHLAVANIRPVELIDDEPIVATVRTKAASVVAAATKARTVIPVARPAKDTLAAAILDAGRKGRTKTTGPEPTGMAARIIAAGKRRRGEKS